MKILNWLLILLIVFFVGLGVYSNLAQQKAVDKSKIPAKVEEDRQFQRWLTNLKNKDLTIEADEFRLQEEVEIYNTKWMKVYSLDDPEVKEQFEQNLESHKNTERVIFSPSEREYIDFRNMQRDGYEPNEVHFYGQKEDKVIDSRVLDCSVRANCYFDRAYFLNNDTFVITEVSRNIDKKDPNTPVCNAYEVCTYTFKLHLVDLVNNSRLVYESLPFDVILNELIPEL